MGSCLYERGGDSPTRRAKLLNIAILQLRPIHLTQVTAAGRMGSMKNHSGSWFDQRFSTEKSCREYLMKVRWPNGFRCPHCGGQHSWRVAQNRFECRACGRQTSVTAGTIFHRSHKPLRLWFRAMWCVASQKEGASAWRLQRALKLNSYQTAWTWLHKLRRAMVPTKTEPLAGTIEVITTCLWGLEDYGALKPENGLFILAAEVDGTGIGRIRMRPIPYETARRVLAFVQDVIAPGSTIRTGWPGGTWLEEKGYCRESSHGEGKNAFRCARLVAEKLEKWLSGTFRGAVRAGAVSQGHLRFYMDEFTFRFNARKAKSRRALFGRLVRQAVATNPIPYNSV